MNKILINFAHPAKKHSKINKALLKAVENLDNVTVNDLYAHYPDMVVDVKREQELLKEHDIIIFQHPFYWYQGPSIIREWEDFVLEHGWAYGSKGKALKGKKLIYAITAGGDENSYSKTGSNMFSIADLLAPKQAMAKLCSLKWLPPFTVHGIHRGLPENKVSYYAEDYRRMVLALRDDKLDIDKCCKLQYINDDLDSTIRREK